VNVVSGSRGARGVGDLTSTRRGDGSNRVNRARVRLSEKKGAKVSARGVKPFRLVPEPQKNFLGHVFGFGLIVQHPSSQAVDGPTVTPVHLSEGHLTETRDERNELGVAGLT